YYDGPLQFFPVVWALDAGGSYIRARRRVDARSRVEELSWFTVADGRPATHRDGYHRERIVYDNHNQPAEVAYFDLQGKPATHPAANPVVTNRHDDRLNLTERTYFDAENKPTACRDGWHRQVSHYNDQDVEGDRSYFDTEGKPAADREGVTRITGGAFFAKDG